MASESEADQANAVSSPRIECHKDLQAFFHETLTQALVSRNVEAPPHTEHYLVGLLSWLGHDSAKLSRSLVELEVEAQSADSARRIERLRMLGDQALSVSGLFNAQLERHGIALSYVADVGARAYRGAAELESRRRKVHAQVFLDLGERFATYAAVLDQVRETTALGTPDDVLSLYERYQRSHAPALLARLNAHGVFPLTDTRADTSLPS